jgi:excisionase family DNA binding protein
MNSDLGNIGGATTETGNARAPARLAYSVGEAARVTGLGKTTLYGLIGQGILASSKVGKRRLIRSADLEALITGQHNAVR